MTSLKTLILVVFLSIFTSTAMKAESTFQCPDFDFPKTVVGDARPYLDSKLPAERFRAVLEIVRAKEAVSTDSLFVMPAFVGSRAAVEPRADYRGLMKLYQARLLRFIFNQYRWQFSSADTPLEPLPEDIALWNAQQFDSVCDSLVTEALQLLAPYGGNPLRDYNEVIVVPKKWKDFYPTLRDFALIQASMTCPSRESEFAKRGEAASPRGTAPWAYWAWMVIETTGDAKCSVVKSSINEIPENVESMLQLYSEYPQGLPGGFLLWSAAKHLVGKSYHIRVDAISIIKKYLEDNRVNIFTEEFNRAINILSAATMKIETPSMVMPGSEFVVKCECEFADIAGIELCNYPSGRLYPQKINRLGLFTRFIEGDSASFAVKVKAPEIPGEYYVRPYIEPRYNKEQKYADHYIQERRIDVTDVVPVIAWLDNHIAVGVADFKDGNPVEGCDMILKGDNRKEKEIPLNTGKNGIARAVLSALDYGYYSIGLKSKCDSLNFLTGLYLNFFQRNEIENDYNGSVFVSRPVYHRGDSVEWAVVLSENMLDGTACSAYDTECQVILRDANGERIDTVTCILDEYGRASGSFALPTDRLTGRYSIIVKCDDQNVAANAFMVSDFKMAVFKVEDLKATWSGDSVAIQGKATRYTGVPVVNAKVTLEINYGSSLYWLRNFVSAPLATFEGFTDADGTFLVKIPIGAVPPASYTFKVNVASLSGEVVKEAFSVRLGKEYVLEYQGESDTAYNLDAPINFDVTAKNIMGAPDSLSVKWSVVAQDKNILQGEGDVSPQGLTLDLRSLKVGSYTLKVCATDSSRCSDEVAIPFSLYSLKKNSVAKGCVLIVPDAQVEAFEGEDVKFRIGADSDGYVFVFAPDNDGALIAVSRAVKAGFNEISLEGVIDNDCIVQIARVKDGMTSCKQVSVKRVKNMIVKLEGESWRDKLVPGSPEQWTLKFTQNGDGVPGGMIATMYNSSLDVLSRLSWPKNFDNILFPKVAVNSIFMKSVSSEMESAEYTKEIAYNRDGFLNLETPLYAFESEDFMELEWRSQKMMDYKESWDLGIVYGHSSRNAGMLKSAVTNDAVFDAEAEVEESAVEVKSTMAAGVDNGAEAEGQPEQPDFEFREGEVLQALWMPSITIDDDGEASLHFVMPDAVGQWSFRAVAWNDECASPLLEKTLVASRPVMVQATVPRFIRRGDKVVAAVTVMNNYTDSLAISVTTEVFDPANGEALTSWTDTVNVAAGGQTILSKELTAAVGLSTIGFRAKATAEGFTDGEQRAIPVLESATTAIDSEVFFLTEAHPTFTTELRANGSDSDIVAIEYCQNPIWEAVKTLPGMYEASPATALAAANSAYAAAVARSLYDRFPEIRNALGIWQTENGGEALESKLVKDEDLKLLTLARTPFVGAANANTEQMERLALTFDKKIVDKTFDTAIATLASLQKPDGGFSWGSWSDGGSLWVTEHVLECFGRLNSLGCSYKNAKLEKMLDRAFAFIDSKVGKGIFDLEYTLVYSLFRDRKVSTLNGQQTISATLNHIFLHWDGASVADKSVFAIVLQGFGRTSMAREIMRSVEEFAVEIPREGVTIPSVNYFNTYAQVLEAFGRVNPSAKIASGLRQWIVFNSPTVQDLGTWSPATLVAAILMTVPGLPAVQPRFDITLAGEPVVPEKYESYTGAFSMRVEPSDSERQFEVRLPQGCEMAYGAVVNVGKVPLSHVKPTSNEHVSVAKRFLVRRDGQWVETTDFRLGEAVKVQLTVTTDRPLEYVTIVDERPAAFEPVDQLPGWARAAAGVSAYRESGDDATRLYIGWLPQGSYYIEYDATATYGGSFASGVATLQSQRAPEFTGRSGATTIKVE